MNRCTVLRIGCILLRGPFIAHGHSSGCGPYNGENNGGFKLAEPWVEPLNLILRQPEMDEACGTGRACEEATGQDLQDLQRDDSRRGGGGCDHYPVHTLPEAYNTKHISRIWTNPGFASTFRRPLRDHQQQPRATHHFLGLICGSYGGQ